MGSTKRRLNVWIPFEIFGNLKKSGSRDSLSSDVRKPELPEAYFETGGFEFHRPGGCVGTKAGFAPGEKGSNHVTVYFVKLVTYVGGQAMGFEMVEPCLKTS